MGSEISLLQCGKLIQVGGCVLDDEREGTVDRGTDRVATGGWVEECRASRDLVLSDAARAVSQGVDMAVGNWAEVFIGNGVRSAL
jgi:hypothetical protein